MAQITTVRVLACSAALITTSAMSAHMLAAMVSIAPSSDNTLFEDPVGSLSNGSGQYLFAGVTAMEAKRRALIRFDIASSVPAGATITAVSLQMYMSRGGTSLVPMSLHRATGSWGEGTSDADLEEGTGAPAAPGDATWLHREFSNLLWSTPGGDFNPTSSVVANIGGVGFWTWSSTPAFTADVQSMLDAPAQNFGWLLLGDEVDVPPTAKRFDSRENPIEANRPMLMIEYVIPAPGAATAMAILGAPLIGRRRRPQA